MSALKKRKNFFRRFIGIFVFIFVLAIILLRIFVTGKQYLDDLDHENEASFLSGDSTICLLIHGFASGPQELKYLAEHLHGEGYSVRTVLLRGHNQRPLELSVVTWEQWDNQIKAELKDLKSRGFTDLFVIGFSMGGLLALRAGLDSSVSGVVLINPCVFVFDRDFYHLPLKPMIKASSFLVPYLFRKSELSFYYQHHKYKRVVYHQIPLTSVYQLMMLTDSTTAILTKFNRPILIIHAEDDKTVDPYSSKYIYASVKSALKFQHILPSGGHLIVLNDRRDEVFTEISSFIKNLKKQRRNDETVLR